MNVMDHFDCDLPSSSRTCRGHLRRGTEGTNALVIFEKLHHLVKFQEEIKKFVTVALV